MADDPILKAIQGSGGAAVEEEEDPILAAIKAPAPKAASNLRTPTMDEAVTGRVPESESATLPTQRAAKVGKPALPLGPPKNPNPLNLDATQVPVAAFPYRYNQYTPASAPPPQPEVSQEEIAQQLMKTASPAELAARAKSGLPMTPEAIDTSRKAGQNFEDAMMTGPSQLNFPLSVGVPGTIPSGVVPVRPADIQQEAATEINNPNIPKTQSEAFWKGFSADAIKNLNDMFLSPVGLTSSALGASETVALARAGTFGGDALKLAQEYQAMRAAGASAAELVDVEKKMQQAILQAAKAQKVATAGKVAGQAAGGAFAGQGATNIVEGAKDKDLSKVLEGAGQTILGVAAGAGAARGAEESVRAETARRAAESVGEAPTAKRTQQVPGEAQQPPQAPAQPQLPKPAPVGAGESLVAEKPETLNAQVDALKNGTNKVVYFPKGTESIPAPPDNATVTVVKGKKPGAGTYYHTDEVTPEQIQKSVKDGTIGELLGHEQTKEEAHKGQPTTVVARDEQGIEQKASVVDASKPEVVGKQAQTLQNQFPQAKVSVEAPESVIQKRAPETPAAPQQKPAAPLSSQTPQVEEAPKTPERRQERNAAQRQRVSEMTPEQMRSELLTSKVTNLPNRRAFDEAGESGAVAMSDADGLKALNDKFGYAAGNELLKAKADALKEAGLEAYHDKGDEFLYRGKNEQDLQAKLEKAREILKNTTIEATMEDGTVHSFKGADFSYGTGKELSTAETGLKAHKSERESRGERARGELRGITEVGPPKGEVNQSEEAANVEHATPAEAKNQPAKVATTSETAEIAKPAESVKKGLPLKPQTRISEAAELKEASDQVLQQRADQLQKALEANKPAPGGSFGGATAALQKQLEKVKTEQSRRENKTEAAPAEKPSVKVNISGKLQEPLEAHETEAPGLYATKIEIETNPRMELDENGKSKRIPSGKREEWSLTHAGTGLKVPVGPLKNLQEALDTAKKIASVTDWTKDFKNLKKWESAAIGEKLTKALGKSASMRAAEESLEDSEEEKPEESEKELPIAKEEAPAATRPSPAKFQEALNYVKAIQNEAKKAYGLKYLNAKLEGTEPPFSPNNLGTMAAQAVRMRIDEILGENGSTIEPEKEEANGQATESLGARSEQPPAKVPAENARGTESERATGELSQSGGGEGEGRVRGERAIGNERSGSAERSEEESPVPAERGRSAEPGRESHSQSRPGQSGNDYRITDADKIGQGSISEKYAANTDAIRVLKELEASGRPATPEEQSKLVRYSGWGWSGNLLNEYHDKWRNERKELQSLLTEDEYRNAVESTKNAHYTSPQIIKSVWDAVRRLGFSGGRVLEPSAGIGHFFGLMPNDLFVNSRHTAIELDTVSGKILKQLYQTIDARIQGFEKLRGLDNFYDLAISNVPFGDYSVHDPNYKKLKLSIHNYFIAKMLDKVRPGGLVAAITSHHTLDNYKSAIRQVFLDRGDLVGAIRLPADAFKENAGTEVTTDLLLFRKRGPEEKADSQPFLALKPVEATNKRGARENVEINEYFHKHPKMALGEHSLTGSMYGYGNNYELRAGTEPTAKLLAEAIERLPENVMKDAPAPKSVTTAATAESIPNWGETKPFGYMVRDGKVFQSLDGQMVHLAEFPKASVKPLSDLLGIRNATRELFQAEAKGHTPKELTEARGRLNRLYDAFVKSNGFINQPRNLRIMSEDPDAPLLSALEKWDSKAKTASKADVFFKQTIAPRKQVTKVDRPEDSLPASLAEKGRIDFGYMSKLTGLEPKQLQDLLREAGTVFRTPEGHWEANDEYLSGDVRKKLREAEEAAKVEPEFKKNVEALKAIQPRDLEAGEITTRIGTPWIPEEDVAKFIDDVILDNRSYRDRTKVSHVASEAIWKINNSHARYNEAAQTKWGTARMRPVEIFEDALNLRRPTVYDHYKDAEGKDKSVVNEKETLAVREKLEQMEEAFKNWLFKDQERAERLVAHYNENYNNLVDRKYDGSHLTFPGMNAGLTMRPNQKNGIWRSLVGGNTLLAHVVGAGKTFTIVASAMEGRRLGLAKKPMVVVPNHLVEQWASDFLKLYPQARVLAATKEEWGTANRKKLMSRIATGEWDAVIVPHSSFTLLPVSDETYKKYAQRQLDMIEEHIRELTESEGKKSRTVKELAKAKARIEARMEKALNRERKDNTINFEDTGVDRLYVDEAHAYKNLFFSSKMGNINGIPKSDAQRSFDMYMKSKYITDLNNGSGVTFATGTPISNTMAEIYTMQRYMDEALLEQNGLAHFDSWAAAYGQTIQNMEVSPEDPSKFRISTRFAKFNNVAELKRQFRQSADVILAQDLEGVVKVPDIQGGKPTVIEVPASDRVREYIGELGERAKAIRKKEVKPDEDNMLKITSEGRKVALDYRSMFPDAADDGNSKISVAAKRIADIYHSTRGAKSTQAVMLDLMTPSESGKKRGQFNAYADLKNKLVGLGVPAKEIQFIHDAKSDEAKQDLFNRVNSGEVAVILGSSDKMGVGTNIQERLLALHHLDSPWRPSDIEQREGRIVRQGNTNPVVQIYRYVTSGTFDAYMWSGIARKANFIRDMMQHGYDVREMEDVDGASLSYSEAAAIATGDARVLEKVKTDAEVDKLSKLKSIHEQNKVTARLKLAQIPQRIESLEHGVEAVKADIKTRDANKSDEFRLSVGKDVYEERKDAGAALSAAVEANQGGERYKVGKYGGLDIVADGSGNLHIEGRSSYYFAVNHENPLGTIQSLEKTMGGMETRVEQRQQDIEMLKKDLKARKEELDKPFNKQDALDKGLAKQAELNKALSVNAEDKTMAGARPDQEFNENFKAVEPSKAPPTEAEDTDEENKPRKIIPRNPEAGFITGEALLSPFIALGKLVRRMLGKKPQPQQGIPNRPPVSSEGEKPATRPVERAGNIRLDKLNTPEDVLNEIRRSAKDNKNEFDEQRRGKIPFKQTKTAAQQLVESGMFTEKDLAKMQKGTALNAEELLAARGMLIASAKKVREAAAKLKTDDGVDNVLAFQEALMRHDGIQKAVTGAVAEAGRALSQQRIIANALKGNDKSNHERILEAMGGKELSEEAAKRLAQIPEDDVVALNNFLKSQKYWTTAQKIEAYWIANVLSSPRTPIKKVLGDVVLGSVENSRRLVDAAIDPILATIQGRPRETFLREAVVAPMAYVSAIPEATRKASYILAHGFDLEDPLALETPRRYEFPGGIKNPFNMPGRALSAATKYFQVLAFQGELHAQAVKQAAKEGLRGEALKNRAAELIQNPNVNMMNEAMRTAEFQTYTEKPDALSRILMTLRDKVTLPRGIPVIGGLHPMRFVIPFVQIPYNLAKQSVRYSPLGFLRLNDFEHAKSPQATKTISRALIGSAIMALFAYLAAKKMMTGPAPKDSASRDEFYRSGQQPYSIKFGHRWVSYKAAGPFALNAAATVAMYDRFKAKESMPPLDVMASFGSAMGQAMLDESFLRGIKNLTDALSEPNRYASRMASGTFGGFIPFESALRTASDAFDPTVRNPQSIYEHILAGLPVVNKSVAPKLDVFGRPSTKEGTAGFASLFPGGFSKDEPKSDMDAELSRLHDLGMKNVGFAGKHLTIDNYKINLTPEEQQQYQKARGAYLSSYLKQTFGAPEYKQMTDQEKIEAAEEAIHQAGRDAHEQVGDQVLADRLKKAKSASIPRRPPASMKATAP